MWWIWIQTLFDAFNQSIYDLLPQVESCLPGDVTWALGYDSTAWVYTGGWGGGHFKVDLRSIFQILIINNVV